MKHRRHYAALAAAVAIQSRRASLRSVGAFAASGVEVDEKTATIRNAAVMTLGPAEGHGWSVDETTLNQLATLINAKPGGVQVRFTHPDPTEEGEPVPETLGTDVGYLKNARVEGGAVRGDIQLGDYAEVLPGLGNVKDYLLRKAKSDPRGIGLSPVVYVEFEESADGAGAVTLLGRLSEVYAVDFVGKGATTPNGLLSATSPTAKQQEIQDILKAVAAAAEADAQKALEDARASAAAMSARMDTGTLRTALAAAAAKDINNPSKQRGVSFMNAKIKQCLTADYGLPADATDEQAQTKYESLSAEDKAKVDAKCAQMSAKAPEKKPEGGSAADAGTVAQLASASHEAMLAAEGKRVTMLRQLGDTLNVDGAVVNLAIANGETVDTARVRYLKHLQEKCKPVEGLGAVQVGEDKKIAALRAAIPDGIMLRAGLKVEKPHELAAGLQNLPVLDMYRQWLVAAGAPASEVHYLSKPQLVDLLGPRACARRFGSVTMLAQGVGYFDAVLVDAINKSARLEYQLAPKTWTTWARQGTAPDFKTINRVQLSDVPGLVARAEGGEIKYNVLSDSNETYVLAEYSNGLRLTRRAMINDDLDMFSRIPRAQMASGRQLEDDVCYAVLTGNAAMSDTGLLFNATAVTSAGGHANLDSATANVGAPSITLLGRGRAAMRKQTGPKGNKLNLTCKFLIVPAILETTAEQLVSPRYVAQQASGINPFASDGRTPLTLVVEPRLDDSSATAWYLAADSAQIDTVEVCFLQGEEAPVLKQETDFDTDDMKFAVRHTVAAKALDFRGLFKNNGA